MHRYSIHDLFHRVFYTGIHRDGIRAIFWGSAIRQFAATTVGLFVPIFVYKVGVSYGGSIISGLRVLIIFLILSRITVITVSLFVEYLIDSIGFRWTLLISSFFLFAKFILLSFAETHLTYLWIAAVVSGAVTSTYWISRHALFGEDQSETNIGSSVGLIIVLTQLSTIIGPVFGGLIAAKFGFTRLFHLGLFLAVVSTIPYFFMHHHRRHRPDGLLGFIDKLRDPVNFPLMVAWFGRSWDANLILNFWPLYIFLAVGAVEKLGILTSMGAVVSMLASYAAGRIFDKTHRRKQIFLTGAGLSTLIWPVKALARSFWSIFAIDSLHAIGGQFYWIPFLSETYKFSFRRDTVAFFAFREVIFSIGIMMFLILAFLLTFSWSWTLVFLLGGLGVVLSMNLVSYQGFR